MAGDKDDDGKPISNAGPVNKPEGAKTGSTVPAGVVQPGSTKLPPNSFYFTAELQGIGTMLPNRAAAGAKDKGSAQRSGPAPGQAVLNATGDEGVDDQARKDGYYVVPNEQRIHTQLDRDNGIDVQGNDLNASTKDSSTALLDPSDAAFARYNHEASVSDHPSDEDFERYGIDEASQDERPSDEDFEKYNGPAADEPPNEIGNGPVNEDGPAFGKSNLSDEFRRRSGPGD